MIASVFLDDHLRLWAMSKDPPTGRSKLNDKAIGVNRTNVVQVIPEIDRLRSGKSSAHIALASLGDKDKTMFVVFPVPLTQ